ncbi:MAG: VOC family protein [Chlamydiia bacterium]|nr:VOC family protein [Chlamydiia bacterium]
MISSVKHVTIPVKDQDRACAFYTQKLGFQVLCDTPFGEGQRWIELKIPDADTQVVLFTPEGHEERIGTFSNIVFTCKDVKETHKTLQAKGVQFTQEPEEAPWGTFALFKDSEGNAFCLSSS